MTLGRFPMSDSYLITGGAGFIGANLAHHYLARNKRVTIFDHFSRPGTEANLRAGPFLGSPSRWWQDLCHL